MSDKPDNQNPLKVILVKEKKEWYKKWWGLIIALLTLPFFIIWYAWAKSSWNKGVKVIVTIIASLVIIGMPGESDSSNVNQITNTADTSVQQDTSIEAKTDKTPKIGTVVQDGKFEFLVDDFECGIDYIESRYGSREEPHGQYCTLTLSVKNIGQSQQEYSPNAQKLLDSSDIEYSYDSAATYYKNNSDDIYQQINPGNAIDVTLVFDIPIDGRPTITRLHDSIFSNGTEVLLQN